MAGALQYNTALQQLDLRSNVITDTGTQAICTALLRNTSLRILNLSYNKLRTDGAYAIADLFRHSTTLRALDLSENLVDDDGVQAICSALVHHNTSLQKLDLSYNEFRFHGVSAIAGVLRSNTTLQTLDLSYNMIGDDGMQAISSVLAHHNKSLQRIILRDNGFRDIGAKAIANVIQHNTSLKTVALGANMVSGDGAVAIMTALQHNTSLRTLDLRDNMIADDDVKLLAVSLQRNTTLRQLSIAGNCIGDVGASAISTALQHNPSLRLLHLYANYISDDGAKAVAASLHHNTSLQELFLARNHITDDGLAALATALLHNTSLEHFDFHKFRSTTKHIIDVIDVALQRNQEARTMDNSITAYDKMEEVGHGTFGTVWQAVRKRDLHVCAIKEIRNKSKLHTEIAILRQLRSPFVVQYYTSFTDDTSGTLCIVTELCDSDLAKVIINARRAPLSDEEVMRYFAGAVAGLYTAHIRGHMHRDIKPANYLLKGDVVKLADLGLSKATMDSASEYHTMAGTWRYCSPELIGGRRYGKKNDVWALGCILYELCTSRQPFVIGPNNVFLWREHSEGIYDETLLSRRYQRVNPHVSHCQSE